MEGGLEYAVPKEHAGWMGTKRNGHVALMTKPGGAGAGKAPTVPIGDYGFLSDGEVSARELTELALAKSGFMPARRLDKLEMAEVVRVAMDSLGERQRMALLLCKFEGLSYQEIAEAMDLSVQAVKSLLSRARVNLKQMLEPYVTHGQAASTEVSND